MNDKSHENITQLLLSQVLLLFLAVSAEQAGSKNSARQIFDTKTKLQNTTKLILQSKRNLK